MKLCYIISEIDRSVNLELTATGLRSRGIEPYFILINCTGKGLHQMLMENNFQVDTIEAGNLLSTQRQIEQVKQWLIQHGVTMVHCHLAHANWIGLKAAKKAAIPVRIFTRHAGKPLRFHWKERIIDTVQNRLATKIVSISPVITSYLRKQFVSSKKITYIPHGFDIERFNTPDQNEITRIRALTAVHGKSPVIGCIARWMEWKGVQYVIESFTLLLAHYPDAKLVFFGGESGDFTTEINELLKRLPQDVYSSIKFEQNVFDLYHIMDVYVHIPVNSTCEAFGQTYVEALAAGIPSVFTLSGIAQEFAVHEQNCMVVPYRDAQATATAIESILTDEQVNQRLRVNGKQTALSFDFDRYLSKLVELYSSR